MDGEGEKKGQDMILFEEGYDEDYWQPAPVEKEEQFPLRDNDQNLDGDTKNIDGLDMVSYNYWRKLKTDGNQDRDFEVKCNETYPMEWSTRKEGATDDEPENWRSDKFEMELKEDCTIVLSGAVYKALGLLTAAAASMYL